MRTFLLFLVLAAAVPAQTPVTRVNSNQLTVYGLNVTQNTPATTGGYIQFPPVTYNPYDNVATCYDAWGNPVQQPLPYANMPPFGPNDLILWNSLSPSLLFNPGTGFPGLIQNVILTSPASTGPGPCGTPLPVNTDYGLNTNGYFFARAGLATDIPKYNSIQSLQGGFTGNSFTAGVLYPAGTVTTTGILANPAYLGGHIEIGHSMDPPAAGTIATVTNPFSGGEGNVQGQMFFSDRLGCGRMYDGSAWHCFSGNADFTSVVAGTFNSTATGSTPAFLQQSGTFSITGAGNAAFQSVNANFSTLTGQVSAPALSASTSVNLYYNPTTSAILGSYNGSAYTGLKSPVFNGVVTGLGAGAKTFQNSDGSFTIDYQGNGAFQSVAANSMTIVGSSFQFNGKTCVISGSSISCT